VFLVTT